MAADWLPEGWSLPQLLLAALVVTVVLTGVVAASTSQTAFGTYNAKWDGASDLREIASEEGAEPVIALNTTAYMTADPNGTVAVILSPDEPYTPGQRTRVAEFVRAGGTLVVAEDFGSQTRPLLAALGVETRVTGVPLRDEQEYYRSPAFPVATNVSESPATEGVDALTLNHGSSLRTDASENNTTVLVSSSDLAYLDRNRSESLDESEELASRPVVVREQIGNGTVFVVSDPSIFINAMLERPGNERFARNLVAGADTVLLDYSHLSGQPPLMVAVLTLQDTPFWQALLSALGLGAVVWSGRLRTGLRRLADRVGGSDQPADNPSLEAADPEEIVAYLSRRHPNWDEERLRRVMRGVIRDDRGTQGDE